MSRHVFVSYVRENEANVKMLAADIRELGNEVWFDRAIPPGAPWWSVILERIRGADVVAAVMSPTSIESFAFEQETKYAALVNRLILPVLVEPVSDSFVPRHLSELNRLDYTSRTPETALSLGRAFSDLPLTPDLPEPLPPDPPAPEIYMPDVQRALESRIAISRAKQQAILQQLKMSLANPTDRLLAIYLLRELKGRTELLPERVQDIEQLLERVVAPVVTAEVPIVTAETPSDPPRARPQPPDSPRPDPVAPAPRPETRIKYSGKGATTSTQRGPSPQSTATRTRDTATNTSTSSATATATRTETPPRSDSTTAPVPAVATTSRAWGTWSFMFLVVAAVLLVVPGIIAGFIGIARTGKRGQGLALLVASMVSAALWLPALVPLL